MYKVSPKRMQGLVLFASACTVVIGLGLLVAGGHASAGSSSKDPAWAFPPSAPGNPHPETNKDQTLPGSTETFSRAQLLDRTTAVDWFPDDHPPMPAAVKGGRSAVYACGYRHLPEGLGR